MRFNYVGLHQSYKMDPNGLSALANIKLQDIGQFRTLFLILVFVRKPILYAKITLSQKQVFFKTIN